MAVVDMGWKRIKRELNGLNRRTVNSGLLAALVGAHLVMIAVWNHFGTRKNGRKHIPARPFMKHAWRKARAKIAGKRGLIVRSLDDIYRGRSNSQVMLKNVGRLMQEYIENAILFLRTPVNAAATVRIKGFDKPLVHTQQLLKSIRFEVI